MRRMMKIYIGPEKQTEKLAAEILEGKHGEKAKTMLETEIQKRMPETNDLWQKINAFVATCQDTKLLESIISQTRGDQ